MKPQGSAWKCSSVILCFLSIWLGQARLFAFTTGDRVQANGTVNVRSAPGDQPSLGTQPSGSQGTIIGGPTVAYLEGTSSIYTWWNINFSSGLDGWVADIGLLSAPPTVSTLQASLISKTSAQVNASVNPNGASTTVYFQYGPTTSYGNSTGTGNFGNGTATLSANSSLTGLAPGTLFHYRIVAYNSGGTSEGSDRTFTTSAQQPTVQTLAATLVGTTTARMNASYDARGAIGTIFFQYGLTTSYGNSTPTGDIGPTPDTGSWDLSNLNQNTTYHYRAVVTTIGGTSYGDDVAFQTSAQAKPTVQTMAATSVTATSARLNASYDSQGVIGTLYFQYGTTLSYGSTTTAGDIGTTPDTGYFVVSGLAQNTTYHFRAVAANSGGPSYGLDRTFTTAVGQVPPTVQTFSASSVTTSSAWLNGHINPNGASTTAYYEYGTTTSYGTITPSGNFGLSVQDIGFPISGLAPNTTYHFRIVASNIGGTGTGTDSTFTTGAPANPNFPAITTQPQSQTVPVGTGVLLTVTAAGATPRYFQWRRNGVDMPGSTASSLTLNNVQLGNAGDYVVVVNNSHGTVTSAVAKLVVFPPPPTLQPPPPVANPATQSPSPASVARPRVPSSAQLVVFTGGGLVDRNKMTIVLTHGWLSSSAQWPTLMKNSLVANGYDANIVAWDWHDNANTIVPSTAAARTCSEGEALGSELLYVLGAGYNKRIHFIGHSFGTLVNCHAADFIHGDAKNSPGKIPGSTLKLNPANTHMTLLDEAELIVPVNGLYVFPAMLINRDTAGDLINCFWAKVIPEQSAWVDNYISEFGLLHRSAANVWLYRNAGLGIVDSHGYAYRWYSKSIDNPLSGLMGHRWSFERNTLHSAPARGTYFLQSLNSDTLTLEVTQLDSFSETVAVYASLQGYRLLDAIGSTVQSAYLDGIQYAGNFVYNVAQTFTPPTGQPVFVGNANSTPAYYIPTSSSLPEARWDLQVTVQKPGTLAKDATSSDATGETNVFVLIPVNVPSDGIGMSFEFRLAGAGTNEYFTMGITNANYFTMEAKFVEDGVWTATSVIDISQYAGQSVQLFFSLNDDTPPNGVMSVRKIQFYSPPKPDLAISMTNARPVLSWPMSAIGWELESTDTLSTSNQWLLMTNVPSVLDYHNTVIDDTLVGRRFYRLKK